jgi:hypothetical protein
MEPRFYAYREIGHKETEYCGALYNCSLYSHLFLSKEFDAASSSRLLTEEFTGIVLGCSDEDYVLIVESKGDVEERVGIIDVANSFLRGERQVQDSSSESYSESVVTKYHCCHLDDWKLDKTQRTIRLS